MDTQRINHSCSKYIVCTCPFCMCELSHTHTCPCSLPSVALSTPTHPAYAVTFPTLHQGSFGFQEPPGEMRRRPWPLLNQARVWVREGPGLRPRVPAHALVANGSRRRQLGSRGILQKLCPIPQGSAGGEHAWIPAAGHTSLQEEFCSCHAHLLLLDFHLWLWVAHSCETAAEMAACG